MSLLSRKFYVLVTILFLLLYIFYYINIQNEIFSSKIKVSKYIPVIVWWTPFTGVHSSIRKCNYGSCLFTEDRKYFQNGSHDMKAILFYGSDFKIQDLPLPRKHWHWWGLLHEESPKNQPLFDHEVLISLFNFTSTFKESSNMPLILQYLKDIDSLISKENYIPTNKKNELLKTEKLSPLIYLQSDCNSPSERDEYVKTLSNYISIDSYGMCLKNKDLPPHLYGIESMNHPDVLKLFAKYKFTVAFENAACEDYITEKLWRPLIAGSIPIYWGSPTVTKWLPNSKTIVHVRDFQSPLELSTYLLTLLSNDTLYDSYLNHKILGVVENHDLISSLESRPWGINDDDATQVTYVESFECFVCDSVIKFHNNSTPGMFMANKSHYGCPPPETVLVKSEENKSFWVEQWYKAEVEAQVLNQLMLESSGIFSMETFYQKVIELLEKNNHFKRFYSDL